MVCFITIIINTWFLRQTAHTNENLVTIATNVQRRKQNKQTEKSSLLWRQKHVCTGKSLRHWECLWKDLWSWFQRSFSLTSCPQKSCQITFLRTRCFSALSCVDATTRAAECVLTEPSTLGVKWPVWGCHLMVDRKCDPTGRPYTTLEKLAVRNFLFISATLGVSSCFMQEKYLKRKHSVAGVRYLRWRQSSEKKPVRTNSGQETGYPRDLQSVQRCWSWVTV